MEKKSIRVWLAEQHRNTRHDAIDQLQDIRDSFIELHTIPEPVWDALINRVMNLKQRLPEGAPTFDDICTHCKRYNFQNRFETDKQRVVFSEHCNKQHFSWIDGNDRKPVEHCNDFKD